ncbi:thiamine pyrophosphate-binding protein [Mucilaginibacter sp.]
MKISDYIADFLAEKEIKHVFGIIGAGNAHIFDSIYKKGYTEVICVHHEQAACMAMQTYYRTCGKVTAVILTTGAGSTNGVTGVVSAWADSIPGLIISGNENSKFVDFHKDLRMWGVQGYNSALMVDNVTKYSSMVMAPENTKIELEKAYAITTNDRPGPCWVDIPMNIQSAVIADEKLLPFTGLDSDVLNKQEKELPVLIKNIAEKLYKAKRPVFWLGHGIRLAGAYDLITSLIEKYNVPSLVTWAGIDMVDSYHPLIYGRAGTYGQRCANFVVQNCDLLVCIGTRMAISQIGYEINELARDAEIAVVDIDADELKKYAERYSYSIHADAKDFITGLLNNVNVNLGAEHNEWVQQCNKYRSDYPWVNETDHPDKDGFINSYKFMDKLNEHLKSDQHITTDMGTALLSGHQVLKIKNGQRLMTSTGLGEMGYGLPAAVGVSVARNKGEVMCLNCDGGMMMNLQELQTMVHYKLPIKLFIFNNDGYLMIKHTQSALFNGRRSGVDEKSGVSCPDFSALATAFKIPAFQIRTWDDFDEIIPQVQAINGPVICEVFMHPYQLFVPKLSLSIQKDGTLISPPLEDLSPFLPRNELKNNMISGLHAKSEMMEV